MANNNLHIVGTIHLDPRGGGRLDSFIQGYNPGIIGLEMAENRENVHNMLRENLDRIVDGLEPKTEEERRVGTEFVTYVMDDVAGFELKSIEKHRSKCSGIPLDYIDSDIVDPTDYVNLIINNVKRFFPVDLEGKGLGDLRLNLREIVSVIYFLCEIGRNGSNIDEQDLSGMNEQDIRTLKAIYSDERDDTMASKIRNLYNEENGLLAVVGLGHLRELGRRLEDLDPVCLPLDDAGKIY